MAVCCHTANKYSKAKYFLEHNEFHDYTATMKIFPWLDTYLAGIESDHLSQLSVACVHQVANVKKM